MITTKKGKILGEGETAPIGVSFSSGFTFSTVDKSTFPVYQNQYGPGYGYGLDLSAEQREKIGEIQQEFAQKHWGLMTSMHSPGGPMEQMFSGDEKAARQAYDAMAAARKQMFEAQLDMRKQVEAVLTKEQREQLQRNYRGRRGR